MSCGCVTHAAAPTWNLPGLAHLPQFLLSSSLSPIQVYTSVRLLYYREIQEELNLPFPFLLMKQADLRLKTKTKQTKKNSKEILSE